MKKLPNGKFKWIFIILQGIITPLMAGATPVNHYSDYGVIEQSDFVPDVSLSINNDPFGYSDAYTDSESGLQYLQIRYYEPVVMRFTQMDTYPLLNRYDYANENPVMNDDPSGHVPVDAGTGSTESASTEEIFNDAINLGMFSEDIIETVIAVVTVDPLAATEAVVETTDTISEKIESKAQDDMLSALEKSERKIPDMPDESLSEKQDNNLDKSLKQDRQQATSVKPKHPFFTFPKTLQYKILSYFSDEDLKALATALQDNLYESRLVFDYVGNSNNPGFYKFKFFTTYFFKDEAVSLFVENNSQTYRYVGMLMIKDPFPEEKFSLLIHELIEKGFSFDSFDEPDLLWMGSKIQDEPNVFCMICFMGGRQ